MLLFCYPNVRNMRKIRSLCRFHAHLTPKCLADGSANATDLTFCVGGCEKARR